MAQSSDDAPSGAQAADTPSGSDDSMTSQQEVETAEDGDGSDDGDGNFVTSVIVCSQSNRDFLGLVTWRVIHF